MLHAKKNHKFHFIVVRTFDILSSCIIASESAPSNPI